MYDKHPFLPIDSSAADCASGWPAIFERLQAFVQEKKIVVCVECYPGVFVDDLACALQKGLHAALTVRCEDAYADSAEINRRVRSYLTDDPVFGRMNEFEIEDFFDRKRLE